LATLFGYGNDARFVFTVTATFFSFIDVTVAPTDTGFATLAATEYQRQVFR